MIAIADDRVQEIVDELNSFRTYEYEHYTNIVNGRVVHGADKSLDDPNLGQACAWAESQPEVLNVVHRQVGRGSVRSVVLTDSTDISWDDRTNEWVLEAADEPAAS